MMKTYLLPLVATAVLSSASAALTLDFNNYGTNGDALGINTVSSTNSTAAEVWWNSTGGLSGTGALTGRMAANGIDGNMTSSYVLTTNQLSASGAMDISVYFYFDPAVTVGANDTRTAGDRAAVFGYKDNSSFGGGGTTGNRLDGAANSLWVRMGGDYLGADIAGGYEMEITFGVRNGNVGANSGQTVYTWGTSPNPPAAAWYYWTATFTPTGDNAWSMSSALYNSSATGVVGSQIGSTATWTTSAGPLASSLVAPYGALQVGESDRLGALSYDNFTVVPEPSTYAILAGLVALGLVMYRRRR